MIIADTGFWVGLFDYKDSNHRKALSLPPSKTELPAASCHFLIRSKYEHYIKMVPPY